MIYPGSIAVRTLAEGLAFPEGPVWLPDGSIILVEIRAGTLMRVWPDGRKADTGRVETLYDHVDGRRLCGPNDLVFDAHGGFWFTDYGKTRDRDLDLGSVYYAKTDGSLVREVLFPLFKPNGIGLSPDGKTLYVCETETARLWAWTLAGPGALVPATDPKVPVPHGGRLIYTPGAYARFDSLAVEANGFICVATLAAGGISVCAPDGSGAEFIPTGDPMTTNICFGGPNLRKAYVTLSASGRLVEMDWPRAGLRLHGY